MCKFKKETYTLDIKLEDLVHECWGHGENHDVPPGLAEREEHIRPNCPVESTLV